MVFQVLAHVHDDGVLLGNLLAGIFLVGGSGVEVELGGVLSIETFEYDVSVAAADVQGLLELQLIAVGAYGDGSAAAYVDHSDLAALGEILRAEDVG